MWWHNSLAIRYQFFLVDLTTPGDGQQQVRMLVSVQVEETNSEMSVIWCVSIWLGAEPEYIPYGLTRRTGVTGIVAGDIISYAIKIYL